MAKVIDHLGLEDTDMILTIKIERRDGEYHLTVPGYVLGESFDTISHCVRTLVNVLYQACLDGFTTLGERKKI